MHFLNLMMILQIFHISIKNQNLEKHLFKYHFMRTNIYFVFLLAVLLAYNIKATAGSEVGNLRCEYLENPIGIDSPKPRLTWMMVANGTEISQSAYQLIVGTDSTKVASGSGDKWTTGKVASAAMLTEYNGSQLEPFTRYFWSVKIFDEAGNPSSNIALASFETGMMKMENWNGAWISDTRDIKLKPAPYFRKEFIANKKIINARAYIAVAGLFELYVNGEKVGNHRLDPMYTRFDRRTLYLTHDITKMLKEGKNAVGVLLGNGWYNHQSTAVWFFDLGRNIAGVSQLKVNGQAGTIIRLKHGERLLADGMVDQSNIDAHYRPTDQLDPFGTDIYTLKGEGEETFKPSFNYKGFQYVEVTSDQPVDLKLESLTGYFMHSDVPVVGHIQSSDSILNKIWKATNASYLSNLFGYPTDCPQREKNGWTGDAHTAIEVGLYNFDGITVYEKWMADHLSLIHISEPTRQAEIS